MCDLLHPYTAATPRRERGPHRPVRHRVQRERAAPRLDSADILASQQRIGDALSQLVAIQTEMARSQAEMARSQAQMAASQDRATEAHVRSVAALERTAAALLAAAQLLNNRQAE